MPNSYELELRHCALPNCKGTFRVLPNDPQKYCSTSCQNHSGEVPLKTRKLQSLPKPPIEKQRKSQCHTKTLRPIEKKFEQEQGPDTSETKINLPKIEKKIKPKLTQEKEEIMQTNQTSTENMDENATTKTLTKVEEKSSLDDENLIPQSASLPQLMTSKLEGLPTFSLIDDSAKHLYDSMKELSKKDDHEDTLPTHRAEAMIGCARELRCMMKLKLDVFKFAHEASK